MEEPFLNPREARSLARQAREWARRERVWQNSNNKDSDLRGPSPLETDLKFLVRIYGRRLLFIVGKYATSLVPAEDLVLDSHEPLEIIEIKEE